MMALIKPNLSHIKKIRQIKKFSRDRNLRIKLELFEDVFKLQNVNEACKRAGFGRSFYYKWWKRFYQSNLNPRSLVEQSRRPHSSPMKMPSKYEAKIRRLKRSGHGPRMIQGVLSRENIKLATSTINHVLNKRKPPVKVRRVKLKKHRKRYELPIPGQRLQMDVKYVPRFVNDQRIFNYVIVDECTRIRFVKAYPAINSVLTVDFIERAKAFFPFPIHCIQTDNGQEFTWHLSREKLNAKNHLLDDWCAEQNIKHKLIPVGVKEHNGKVERSHRIDEQYFYWRAPTTTIEAFNKALDEWIFEYNHRRPHGGISYQTPMEKLKERYNFLYNYCFLDKTEEEMKIKFIKFEPRNMSWSKTRKEERKKLTQIERIEQLLKVYNSYREAA
ncbi:MAG: transposase [Alphaproteobacteria bacterium]|nr:MAG: transposase [Alphaproteobacteria bacterium]